MSALVVGLTLARLPVDDTQTLAVAIALADHANQWGERVFPSVSLVATLARCADRTAQYAMRRLEEMGFLVKVKEGGGRGNPTEWRIDLDWLQRQEDKVEALRQRKKRTNRAFGAPISETVQTQFASDRKPCTNSAGVPSETLQKSGTNGAAAGAPEPQNQDPPMKPPPSPSGGGVEGKYEKQRVLRDVFLNQAVIPHREVLAVAAIAAELDRVNTQKLVDALAGGLQLPPGDPSRIRFPARWLESTAQALAKGDFVETPSYATAVAARHSAQAMGRLGSASQLTEEDVAENQRRLAASAAAIQKEKSPEGDRLLDKHAPRCRNATTE